MDIEPLIHRTRGGLAECVHFGSVAVVNAQGKLTAFVGNPHAVTFTRSTLKALQALPFMESGGPEQFGFSQAEVAMLCASHSGEDRHVQATQSMLDKTRLSVRALHCGCHVPYHFDLSGKHPKDGETFDARHNNCSGKHAGFLAYCVQHGLSLEDYIAPNHPLQQAIRRDVALAAGMAVQDLKMGIDGCSAPNYAMPLSSLARAYARLASGISDPEFGGSFAKLRDAMIAQPGMVSGAGRNDLAFMQIGGGDWVTKVGADGVQVVGSVTRREAIAIKVTDGDKPALFAATVAVLDQLGWLSDAQRAALEPWRALAIVNSRGILVGERLPVFTLHTP